MTLERAIRVNNRRDDVSWFIFRMQGEAGRSLGALNARRCDDNNTRNSRENPLDVIIIARGTIIQSKFQRSAYAKIG